MSDTGPIARALPVLLFAALLAGCAGFGTTEKDGRVGDTLSSGGVKVAVIRTDATVPRPRSDITGLGTPRDGMKFFGVKAKVCTGRDQAIRAYDFQLERTGGDAVRPRLPNRAYSDDLDVTRSGCQTGWIVYEIPSADRAQAVRFSYDDSGSARPGATENHARFTWELAG